MLSTQQGIHTKKIEIYENERYSPMSGWSAKGLLLTDRRAWSNHDGSEGFNTLEESNPALISYGWVWDETPWIIDTDGPYDTDADGWTYSPDFSSFSAGSPSNTEVTTASSDPNLTTGVIATPAASGNSKISGTKGMMHFVRRRKYIRTQSFDVNSLTPVIDFTCDYCDLKEVTKLSQLFQDTILNASLKRYPRHFSEVKANLLKNTLWVQLGLVENQNLQTINSSESPPAPLQKRSSFSLFGVGGRSNSVNSDTTAADSNESGASNANDSRVPKELQDGYTYETAFNICQSFISESRTTLSLASSMFSSSMSNEVYIETRRAEINVKMFSHEESHEIARLMIRKCDCKNWYHCRYLNCSTRTSDTEGVDQGCEFQTISCTNPNCYVQFSKKWYSEHDAVCPEKLLSCERVCGEEILRKCMKSHLANDCVLRPVTCPYTCIGCTMTDLCFKDLSPHLTEATQSHMQLSLARVLEHQSVITSLHGKIADLELRCNRQEQEIHALEAAVAAAAIALKASETRLEKNTQDSFKAVNNKIDKVHSQINTEYKNYVHTEIARTTRK